MNCNITPPTKSQVPTEDLEVSTQFSSHVRVGSVIVVKGGVMVNFINQFVQDFSLFLFSFRLQGGDQYWSSETSSLWLFDHSWSGGV